MELNFFGIGAAKCGTSTLHDILAKHPDIFLPKVKETKFISLNYEKGYDWYINEYYNDHEGEKAVGEIYPCLNLPESPKRLHESFGEDLKLLAMFRNPADRAYSNFLAQKRIYNHNIDSFEQGLKELPYLVEKGLYAKHLKRFFELFDQENTRVYIFETDFVKDRKSMIDDVQEFLDVERLDLELDTKSNSAWKPKSTFLNKLLFNRPKFLDKILNFFLRSVKTRQKIRLFFTKVNSKKIKSPKLTDQERKKVIEEYFYDDIKELEKILNRDLSFWYDFK